MIYGSLFTASPPRRATTPTQIGSLAKKKDRNVYDKRLAPKAFVRLTMEAAKKYIRDFGSPGDKWNQTFSPVDLRHAAVQLVEQFEAWYAADYQSTKRG